MPNLQEICITYMLAYLLQISSRAMSPYLEKVKISTRATNSRLYSIELYHRTPKTNRNSQNTIDSSCKVMLIRLKLGYNGCQKVSVKSFLTEIT